MARVIVRNRHRICKFHTNRKGGKKEVREERQNQRGDDGTWVHGGPLRSSLPTKKKKKKKKKKGKISNPKERKKEKILKRRDSIVLPVMSR